MHTDTQSIYESEKIEIKRPLFILIHFHYHCFSLFSTEVQKCSIY